LHIFHHPITPLFHYSITPLFHYSITPLLSLLRKVNKMILPLRHQVTKNHKEFISNTLFLVYLCVFVPLWLKMAFRSGLITPSLHHSITPYSTIPSLHYSITPPFDHSTIPSLHHSITPSLHHSIIPLLHYSITPIIHSIIQSSNHSFIQSLQTFCKITPPSCQPIYIKFCLI
jgi:hypothetical protein